MGSIKRTIERRNNQNEKEALKFLKRKFGVTPEEKCPHCNKLTVFERKERAILPKKNADGSVTVKAKEVNKKIVFVCVRCGKSSYGKRG